MRRPVGKDFDYAMTPFKILSWPVGTWPLQTYNVFSFIRFMFAITILLSILLILNSEMYLGGSNAETKLDALMLFFCGLLGVSKVTCFRVYSASLIYNFVSVVKDYDELNDEEKRTIMRRHAHMSRVTFVGVTMFAMVCSGLLTVLPIVLQSNEDNSVLANVTVEEVVQFPIPSTYVITQLKLPDNLYLGVFVVEFMMLITIAISNLGSDLLFFAIVFHLCGQAEILQLDFSRLVDQIDRATEIYRSLIKRHGHLLKLGGMLNDTISTVLVIQLLVSCVLICTSGFQFILALNDGNIVMVVKSFLILSTLLIQLFTYSYVGNYLKSQMDGIGYSVYSCSWYSLPSNVAKDIIFVILKAHIPVHITAGKFIVVNLETYMSILKTSMSYLSVLRVMVNG